MKKTKTCFKWYPSIKERKELIEFYEKMGYHIIGFEKKFNKFWFYILHKFYVERLIFIFEKEE
jgi:hypothetical protein